MAATQEAEGGGWEEGGGGEGWVWKERNISDISVKKRQEAQIAAQVHLEGLPAHGKHQHLTPE